MTVRMMRSTDRGAPTLAGQQGSMCALLLATMVTGFPAIAPVGLTRSGNEVTCNMPGHGFVSTQTVSVFGANEPEYNGHQIITVLDADNFTYLIAGTPTTPATGTITVGGEKTAGEANHITRVGSVATVWLPGHGFSVGQRARIVGADETAYNGWFTVTAVIDTDNFTYSLPASASPPTTTYGTILVRYGSCGLGWSQLFTATNKKVFQQGQRAGVSQAVLCADETDATNHAIGVGFHMAEGATGISTFTNPCYTTLNPTYTGCLKAATAGSTPRPWIVVGDHRTAIIAAKPGTATLPIPDGWMLNYFGDILSYLPGDAYPQLCNPAARQGSYAFTSTSFPTGISVHSYNGWRYYNYAGINSTQDTYYPGRMPRNHLGQVGRIQTSFCSGLPINSTANFTETNYAIGDRHASYSYDAYPDPVHGGVNMEKLYVKHSSVVDNTGNPVTRGEVRGIWNPGHRRTQVAAWQNNDILVGSGSTAGRVFEVLDLANSAGSWAFLETSDTWGW